jgi:hypothetical protein
MNSSMADWDKWMRLLSNADLIARFCTAVDEHQAGIPQAEDRANRLHAEISRRTDAGLICDDDWYVP